MAGGGGKPLKIMTTTTKLEIEPKTIRDEFAMSALTALIHRDTLQGTEGLANDGEFPTTPDQNDEPDAWEDVAKAAYAIADAMMKARDQK